MKIKNVLKIFDFFFTESSKTSGPKSRGSEAAG
jgi:hypothetical protein